MSDPELGAGFQLLYELKFDEARERFAKWERARPSEPLGPAFEAASDLFEECRRAANVVTARSRIELSSLDAGITEAFAGIARTGSVCVSVDHGEAGTISLLARMHIAVLASETIIERPADLFRPDCLGAKGLHRNFVFITGPSATADMGPLVRGVHGPHRLHLIVLA